MSNRDDITDARDAIDMLSDKLVAVQGRVPTNGAALRLGRAISMMRASSIELTGALSLPLDLAPGKAA